MVNIASDMHHCDNDDVIRKPVIHKNQELFDQIWHRQSISTDGKWLRFMSEPNRGNCQTVGKYGRPFSFLTGLYQCV